MKLALSVLCENPARKTGLTTMFHELVEHSIALYPDLTWIIFAGPAQDWPLDSERLQVVRRYQANDHLLSRLWADHFLVPAAARSLGAVALLTVGFVPVRKCLPTIMHLLSLQHLDPSNKVGWTRTLYRRYVIDRSAADADLIITNSLAAARQITSVYPKCAPRLVVSPEGLQHEQFAPAPAAGGNEAQGLQAQFGLAPGYLLWVSNFYAYKQAELLLAAYARLSPAERARYPLVMVGGGWYGGMDAARQHTARLGIANDVRFLGWVDDAWLAPLYRQARAFVLASREETFGRCVIEAMACGTPCIVNNIPIMREVTGGHAVIVQFTESETVAAGLRTLLTDEDAHARLRTAGITWAGQFSFDRLARERIDAIKEVIGA